MTICYQEYCNVGCNKNVPLLHQLIVCDVFELGCPKQHACIMSNTLAAKAEHIRLLDIKISIKLRGGGLVVKTTASHGHEMYCSWSGGHGFESQMGWTWGAQYITSASKSYLNLKYSINSSFCGWISSSEPPPQQQQYLFCVTSRDLINTEILPGLHPYLTGHGDMMSKYNAISGPETHCHNSYMDFFIIILKHVPSSVLWEVIKIKNNGFEEIKH